MSQQVEHLGVQFAGERFESHVDEFIAPPASDGVVIVASGEPCVERVADDHAHRPLMGQEFSDAFADGRHVFDHVVTQGDTLATIGRYQGTHTGDLTGVPATGRTIDMAVMHIDRVVDGRIIEHRGIGDIDGMWEQLGVTPPG